VVAALSLKCSGFGSLFLLFSWHGVVKTVASGVFLVGLLVEGVEREKDKSLSLWISLAGWRKVDCGFVEDTLAHLMIVCTEWQRQNTRHFIPTQGFQWLVSPQESSYTNLFSSSHSCRSYCSSL
jgi:hypothetical protein